MTLLNKIYLLGINFQDLNIGDYNFKEIGQSLLTTAITILAMYLTVKIGSALITKFVEKQKKLKYSIDSKKAKTLGAVLKSILRYAVYFFGVVTILTQYLGTISLTFAGIGGVAIGFGAQSLVKDIINGIFILFEDQFAVGDYIEVEGKKGVVESVELRVTKLRDLNGDLHIVPNGLITKVTNHSRGAISFGVSVNLGYEEDMDKALDIINKVCEDFKENNDTLDEGPSLAGITDLKENFYTIKIAGKAKAMTQWENENKLRMSIKRALDIADIRLAYSKIHIIGDNTDGKGI